MSQTFCEHRGGHSVFNEDSFPLLLPYRYREKENTSMGMMDIGILTGFKPDQKSLQKVTNLIS